MDATITQQRGAGGRDGFDAALVNLFDRQQLHKLARARTPEAWAELSDAVASCFDRDLQFHESEIAAEILLSLLGQAELDLRQALSARLAHNDQLPLRVALSLANDEISVAKTVLEHSPVLNDLDLMYIVQAHGADHWAAIAARLDLGAFLIGALAEKRDETTARALLTNKAVTLPEGAFRIFAEMAQESDALRVPLVHRAELPVTLVQEIYWAVSVELRASLAQRFPDQTFVTAMDGALHSIQQDIVDGPKPAAPVASAKPEHAYIARNTIAPMKLIEALRLGQFSYFLALFADYTGLRGCMVDTLMKQRGGKGLAIACKARHMDRSDFLTLFMLKSSLSNANKLVDHTEMAQALSVFDRVQADFAQKMLSKAIAGQDGVIPA